MVEARDIFKSYRKAPVLRGVSFTVPSGTAACVVGRNGCGKSTLLSILAGRLLPDAGKALSCGKNVFSGRPREIGYVPQADCLFEDLSAWENLLFWASAAGVSLKASQSARYLELLGLSKKELRGKKIRALSAGQHRRITICTALLHNPACLLLDEPFTGLDLVVKEELFTILSRLLSEGKTVVYTSHNLDEIRLPGKLLVLRDGVALDVPAGQITGNFREFMINLIEGELIHERNQ